MVLMTMIGRVADGLPLAASVHNDIRDDVKHLECVGNCIHAVFLNLVRSQWN